MECVNFGSNGNSFIMTINGHTSEPTCPGSPTTGVQIWSSSQNNGYISENSVFGQLDFNLTLVSQPNIITWNFAYFSEEAFTQPPNGLAFALNYEFSQITPTVPFDIITHQPEACAWMKNLWTIFAGLGPPSAKVCTVGFALS